MFRPATKLRLSSRYQNSQNNGYWCANSALSTHKVSQHDFGRRPSTKNDMSCRCPYQIGHTKLTEIVREPEMAQYAQHSSRPAGWQKKLSTLGTKRTSDYHTLYGTLSYIWRTTPIKREQFLQFTVIRDEIRLNHTTFETNKNHLPQRGYSK
jgi:hypothetical protein